MIEPTLSEMPEIVDDNVRRREAVSYQRVEKSSILYSFLFHSCIFLIIVLSGVSFVTGNEPSTKKTTPPLRAFVVSSAQINHLKVVPATTAPVPVMPEHLVPPPLLKSAKVVEPTFLETNEDKSIKASPHPNLKSFDDIEARIEKAKAKNAKRDDAKEEEIAELVKRIKRHRTDLMASNIPTPESATSRLEDFVMPEEKQVTVDKPLPPAPKATESQKAVKGLIMDPLFLYQQQIANRIRSFMRVTNNESDEIGQCVMVLSLSRDGAVLKVSDDGGDEIVCKAARKATLRVGRFEMPDDDYLYKELSNLRITIKPAL
jgi:cytoskeletal protein RodZ